MKTQVTRYRMFSWEAKMEPAMQKVKGHCDCRKNKDREAVWDLRRSQDRETGNGTCVKCVTCVTFMTYVHVAWWSWKYWGQRQLKRHSIACQQDIWLTYKKKKRHTEDEKISASYKKKKKISIHYKELQQINKAKEK